MNDPVPSGPFLVVVPTYNEADYVARPLPWVLERNERFHVLTVDDATSSRTRRSTGYSTLLRKCTGRPSRGGVLLPPEEARGLGEAIETLVSDPELRWRMSHSARSSARRFEWDRLAHEHVEFMENVADRRE